MTWTEPDFEDVARLLGTRTGLVFLPDRRPAVELGVRRAMARAGVSRPARYAARLAHEPDLFDDLVVELTVGETYFFREPAQFQMVRAVILPELRRRKGPGHPVRAWSAGCASGEEAYSLAMLFADEGLPETAHLLGTDISRAALARAREGVYTSWSLRGEGAALALPHLRQVGDRYVVRDAVRRRVAFGSLNLALDVYPSFANGTWALDLILCRNVLIYFDRATVVAVAGRLFESLAEGGWLITASSDPPLGDSAPFEMVVTDQGVFYRRPQGERTGATGSFRGARAGADAGLAPVPQTDPAAPVGPPVRVAPERSPAAARHAQDKGEVLAAALDDLRRGDYARAAERTEAWADDPEAAALHVRALANLDPDAAERACARAAARHPLSGELHYLRAVLLLGLGREGEAVREARRVLFLDRSLAIAHYLLGSILRRRGDRGGARRAFRNAHELCAGRPPDEVVPLSDGEPAGRVAALAKHQIDQLGRQTEPGP